MSNPVTIDLLRAAHRSDSIPTEWTEADLVRAIERYEQFLLLSADHPHLSMAPTRDIDVIWHLHMLSPVAYHRDTTALFGTLLDHDGGFGKDPSERPLLGKVFERTQSLWQAKYGEPYVERLDLGGATNCWHDCQGRCWHDCKQVREADPLFADQQATA